MSSENTQTTQTNEPSKSDFAVLKLCVNPENAELVSLYQKHVELHNANIQSTPFPDSGFDIFVPHAEVFDTFAKTRFIDMQVKGEMVFFQAASNRIEPCAFMTFPRSSISKTPLMLANHTGIIDSGYRGSLIGAFRCLAFGEDKKYTVDKFTRLLQICHPSLCPIYVKLVPENELSITARGSGGFGSTGVVGV
jgi:dUTP pyrophosphatase